MPRHPLLDLRGGQVGGEEAGFLQPREVGKIDQDQVVPGIAQRPRPARGLVGVLGDDRGEGRGVPDAGVLGIANEVQLARSADEEQAELRRGVFWGIAAVALAASASLFFSLPRETAAGGNVRLAGIVQGVAGIFAAPAFLRFAGSSLFFVGGFMALQSLWAVPWLMHVEGLELAAAARILLVLNLGMLTGQLSIGMFGVRLVRLGVQPLRLLQVGYACLLLVLAAILFRVGPVVVVWFLLGVLSAVNSQSYLAAANNFPREMFGRVSTSINLMVFLGAFLVQWGIGLVLDLLRSWGWAMPEALKFALAVLLLLQAFSYLPLLGWRAGKSGN